MGLYQRQGELCMNLIKTISAAPVITLVAMAAFADDAPAPPTGGALAACRQDVQTLCPNVPRGGGRIAACLKSHASDVSPDCRAALKAAHGHRGQPSGVEPPAGTQSSN
jgi:hypothetical protein